jgi:hypothetical protein
VSPVRYVIGFYIPEDGILHCHPRVKFKGYIDVSPSDDGREKLTVLSPLERAKR